MRKCKLFVMVFMCLLLCGCKSKFDGTWCLYAETPSSLVILNNNVSDSELDNVVNYISKLKDMTSYDVIDNIESASKMINIYYSSKDNIDEYKNAIKNHNGVYSVENKMINKAKEKIVIDKKNYTYGKSLNTLYAIEEKGSLKKSRNEIELADNTKLYYKDKFLCIDKECSVIFTKSDNDCN